MDASNLVRDRRGMGRIARTILRGALESADLAVTLLADGTDAVALRKEFPAATLRPRRTARRPQRYDVVWFPFNGMRFGAVAPSVVTIHDVFAFTEPQRERVARFREQRPILRAARQATRVLTDSNWSRDEIARELCIEAGRIVVIPPAPDPFWFPGAGDALPTALGEQPFALLVGVREKRKNAAFALEVCSRALRGGESLVVVGELSPAQRRYARTLELRAGEISASDAMLRALYRDARVVLVPSIAEGFGLVAVEAMACGAPVIASATTALPEATGGAALLLDPHDAPGWAHEIRRIFDDDAYAAALRRRAAAAFAVTDRTAPARRTLGLLRDLARTGAMGTHDPIDER